MTVSTDVPRTGRELTAWAYEHDRVHGTNLSWLLTLRGSRMVPSRSVVRLDEGQVAREWEWMKGYLSRG